MPQNLVELAAQTKNKTPKDWDQRKLTNADLGKDLSAQDPLSKLSLAAQSPVAAMLAGKKPFNPSLEPGDPDFDWDHYEDWKASGFRRAPDGKTASFGDPYLPAKAAADEYAAEDRAARTAATNAMQKERMDSGRIPTTYAGGATRHFLEDEPAARNALLGAAAMAAPLIGATAAGTSALMAAAPFVGEGASTLSQLLSGVPLEEAAPSGEELLGAAAQGALEGYGGHMIQGAGKLLGKTGAAITSRVPAWMRRPFSLSPKGLALDVATSPQGAGAIERFGRKLTPEGIQESFANVKRGMTPGMPLSAEDAAEPWIRGTAGPETGTEAWKWHASKEIPYRAGGGPGAPPIQNYDKAIRGMEMEADQSAMAGSPLLQEAMRKPALNTRAELDAWLEAQKNGPISIEDWKNAQGGGTGVRTIEPDLPNLPDNGAFEIPESDIAAARGVPGGPASTAARRSWFGAATPSEMAEMASTAPTSGTPRVIPRTGDALFGPGSTKATGELATMDNTRRNMLADPQITTQYLRELLSAETDPAQREFLARAIRQRNDIARDFALKGMKK